MTGECPRCRKPYIVIANGTAYQCPGCGHGGWTPPMAWLAK
jgi:DNA-directed RNA polymerase subunit RPC12/RpoP